MIDPAADSAAQPAVFYLCALLATLVGLILAALESREVNKEGGSGPTAHIELCADSADQLFSALSADGMGLGLFEPLWKLLSPEGALWTLLTTGFSGVAQALGAVLAAIGGFLGRFSSKEPEEKEEDEKGTTPNPPEQLHMSKWIEILAYIGYFRMFMLGVIREWVVGFCAAVFKDDLTKGYVNRVRWDSGWVDFYKNHMFRLIMDNFHRPLASAPDATFDVIERTRKGGWLFCTLHDMECTDKTRKCVNLGSYNYLGFGGVDQFCVPKAREAALAQGWSPCAPRTEGGTMQVHLDLEKEVANYLGKEDAIVLGMGFATNSCILPALFDAQAGASGVLVLSDELNHRSIIEGVRLSGATVRPFKHNVMSDLEAKLQRAVSEEKPWRKIFIVIEGIYSMEGDFCRLREIVSLKNKYKAFLYLDEAHSIGAIGKTGRGVTELLGVPTSEVEVMMGTFTKSFGSAGGYVAASRDVIDALRRNAPGSNFGWAMPPPCAMQALQAFRVISGSDAGTVGAEKLASIRENSNYFRRRMADEGFKILGDLDSPIIPVMLHHPYKMAAFSRMCLERGIAVVLVGYPACPVLYERVRFCISAAHTIEQLEGVVKELTDIGSRVGVLYEKNLPKPFLESRKKKAEIYHKHIRTGPMMTKDNVVVAEEAAKWSPSPLAPAAQKAGGIAGCLLDAAKTVEDRSQVKRDLRLVDPMGFARQPLEASQKAINETIEKYGFGACGPRAFYGTTIPHMEMEKSICKFLGTEGTILYSAGVATISSVLPALIHSGDRVVVDSEVHLGIRTGLRLCKCEVNWIPHNDLKAMEAALAKQPTPELKGKSKKEARPPRTFVVVETLYQRTGSFARLKETVELKEKYGALLVADESMALGVVGKTGRGLFEELEIDPNRIDAIVGSLEHALAGVGGFCAGRKHLTEHQRLAGAGYCFSAASPPASCAATIKVLEDLQAGGADDRRTRLQESMETLHSEAAALAKANSKLKLVSDAGSFVQHLRWVGDDVEEGERALLAAAKKVATGDEGVRVQVYSPAVCTADASFSAKTGAPKAANPSLRLCASSFLNSEDVKVAMAAVSRALTS